MSFEVQDLLALVAHLDERVARVVLRDLFAGLRRDAKPEHSRSGIRRLEARAHGRRFAVGRERDLLRADDVAVVFDLERNRLARITGLRHDDVDHERCALEHVAWRLDARHLDVVPESFGADADCEDGNRSCLDTRERLVERRVGSVGAVRDEDDAGERQSGKIVAHPRQRLTDPRGAARVFQFVGRLHAIGVGSIDAQLSEAAPHELAARLVLPIGDLHAARIVDDDREEILLRHGGLQDERRTEETKDDQRDDRDAQRCQRHAIATACFRDGEIRERRIAGDCGNGENRQQHRTRHAQREIALLEDDRAVFEEKLERRIEHRKNSSPQATKTRKHEKLICLSCFRDFVADRRGGSATDGARKRTVCRRRPRRSAGDRRP